MRAARERVTVRAVRRGEDVALLHRARRRRPRRPPGRSRRAGSPAGRRRGTAPRPSPRSGGSGASRAGTRAASPRRPRVFLSTLAKARAVYVLRSERRRAVESHWIRASERVDAGRSCASSCAMRATASRAARCSGRPAVPRRSDRASFAVAPRRKRARAPTPSRGCCARLTRRTAHSRFPDRKPRAGSRRARGRRSSPSRGDAALAGLPADWSDLYVEIELTSTDYIDRRRCSASR